MTDITTVADLEALYDAPSAPSLTKVAPVLTPTYRQWIEASRFCILSTVGIRGVDASPRGDDGAVVRIVDAQTLQMPDWRGNNRLDSLRNIVTDGRASLMFLVPGSKNVVRINGRASLSADDTLCAGFARKGIAPRTVITFTIAEVYVQCARALLRARLWSGEDESTDLPSVGDILADVSKGGVDAGAYDADWQTRGMRTLW